MNIRCDPLVEAENAKIALEKKIVALVKEDTGIDVANTLQLAELVDFVEARLLSMARTS